VPVPDIGLSGDRPILFKVGTGSPLAVYSSKGDKMRFLIGFLTCLFLLTACATPVPPTTIPTTNNIPESHPVTLDGTFETSLLAVVSKSSPRDNVLLPLDPASGNALPGYTPISLGKTYFQAFSSDRHTLAVVSFTNDNMDNGSLLLIDLPTWKTRRFELDLAGWLNAMTFSPDRKQLAIAYGDFDHKLMMIDVEKGTIRAQSETDSLITHLKFTKDGKGLMLYGQAVVNSLDQAPPQVLLLGAADLSPRWSRELEEVRDGMFPMDKTITQTEFYKPGNSFYLNPGLAFAPDRDTLYIVHADSAELTTVDFSTRKVSTVEIRTKLSWFGSLLARTAGVAHAKGAGTSKQVVVSPDGQFLYVVGVNATISQQDHYQTEETPLGLEILQTKDGRRVEHVDTDTTELSLSPDGRFLYLRNWTDTTPWSEVFDATSRKIIARKESLYATPTLLMNGQFLLISTYTSAEGKYHMSVLQPSNLNILADWTGFEFVNWLTP
jgi:DNA-binding beta-propeller fold protein YncE